MKNLFGPQNSEEAKVFAVEGLLAETQYCIQSVMNEKKISRSELARRLGCSPANVTQMLSEHSNLKLETVARIFHALGDTCIVKSRFLEGQKRSQFAANVDKYISGSFSVSSVMRKPVRRITFDSGQHDTLLGLVIEKPSPNTEFPFDVKQRHLHGQDIGAHNDENRENHALAA